MSAPIWTLIAASAPPNLPPSVEWIGHEQALAESERIRGRFVAFAPVGNEAQALASRVGAANIAVRDWIDRGGELWPAVDGADLAVDALMGVPLPLEAIVGPAQLVREAIGKMNRFSVPWTAPRAVCVLLAAAVPAVRAFEGRPINAASYGDGDDSAALAGLHDLGQHASSPLRRTLLEQSWQPLEWRGRAVRFESWRLEVELVDGTLVEVSPAAADFAMRFGPVAESLRRAPLERWRRHIATEFGWQSRHFAAICDGFSELLAAAVLAPAAV